ncbi:MAG: hypothetical protein CME15_11420, partial [Gemmatimonadetes bacterium]|nr:hypothetical protein [Gemmatimonadota bacterium]
NVIADNTFDIRTGREIVAVDGSARNRITGNRFACISGCCRTGAAVCERGGASVPPNIDCTNPKTAKRIQASPPSPMA